MGFVQVFKAQSLFNLYKVLFFKPVWFGNYSMEMDLSFSIIKVAWIAKQQSRQRIKINQVNEQ